MNLAIPENVPAVYRMEIAFNGANYAGWQKQTNGSISVQEVVERVLRRIFRDENVNVSSCSRTDAGVHALAMTLSFRAGKNLDPAYVSTLLQKQLPHDIRLNRIGFAESSFNAHRSALGKSYLYAVNIGYYNLFLKGACWSWHDVTSVEILQTLLPMLEGTHDFSSFTGKDMSQADPVRTLYRVEMFRIGSMVCFYFAGNGFLYKMIRRLAGAFHEVASGKMSVSAFLDLLEHPRKGSDDDLIAPPEGLYLKKAFYEADEWKDDPASDLPFLI